MSIDKNRRLFSIALVAVAVCACNRDPAHERREYPAAAGTANGGHVGPLTDDTSAEIVSWVDGQVAVGDVPFAPAARGALQFNRRTPAIAGLSLQSSRGHRQKRQIRGESTPSS